MSTCVNMCIDYHVFSLQDQGCVRALMCTGATMWICCHLVVNVSIATSKYYYFFY